MTDKTGAKTRRIKEDAGVVSDSEVLNEFNFRSIGHNIANATLSALGSDKAQGRLDRQHTLDTLITDFNRFLGHLHAKPTLAYLQMYLSRKFGKEFAQHIISGDGQAVLPPDQTSNQTQYDDEPQNAPAQNTSPAQTAEPAPKPNPVKSERDFYRGKSKQAGNNAQNRKYQGDTFSKLNALIASPKQDTRQIIALTKEIIAHAKDYGGSDKERVMAYLKNLRKNPKLRRDVKAQIFGKMKLESVMLSIDMAMYLVENNIKTRTALTEAISNFLTERPIQQPTQAPTNATPGADALRLRYNARMANTPAPAPSEDAPAQNAPAQNAAPSANDVLSRKQLVKYLGDVASSLLVQGKVNFSKKQPNAVSSGGNSEETHYVKTDKGRYKQVNSAPAAKPALDATLLASNLRTVGLDRTPEARRTFELLKKGYSMNKISFVLDKEGMKMNPRFAGALHDTMLGKKVFKMTYTLINELSESSLFPSRKSLKDYKPKEISDIAYLHILALYVLLSEKYSKVWTTEYCRKTTRGTNFQKWRTDATDLYILMHVLSDDKEGD